MHLPVQLLVVGSSTVGHYCLHWQLVATTTSNKLASSLRVASSLRIAATTTINY